MKLMKIPCDYGEKVGWDVINVAVATKAASDKRMIEIAVPLTERDMEKVALLEMCNDELPGVGWPYSIHLTGDFFWMYWITGEQAS